MLLNFVAEQLVRDYFIFVYLLCLSALQLAAARSGLRGLAIVPAPWGVAAGLLFALTDVVWFVSSADRNTIGLAGWEQFLLFLMGSAGALLTSLAISSLLWRPGSGPTDPVQDGVEALRYMSYWEALASRRTH